MLAKRNGGHGYEDGNGDLRTRLGGAQRMPRYLLDSKGTLPFSSVLSPQPQMYCDIALNKVCSCLLSPYLVPEASIVSLLLQHND